MRPKIAYDLRSVASPKKSGVETYISQVALEAPKYLPECDFYFFIDRHTSGLDLNPYTQDNVVLVKSPTKGEQAFWRFVNMYARYKKFDVFHFPLGLMPIWFSGKKITTIYDLTYEIYPEFYPEWEADLQKKEVPRTAAACDMIIADSFSTKSDIIKFYNIPDEKISVVYPPITNKVAGFNRKKTNEVYFLAIGNVQPRKNFVRIIEALAQIKSQAKLYIVGKEQDAIEMNKIRATIQKYKLGKRVEITGYVSDERLAELYAGAKAVVYPSIYEGFGYPVLEAFANEIPLITANVSSTKELAEGAALLVDPMRVKEIAGAMDTVLASAATRKKLVIAGSKRLQEIEDHNFGKEVAAVYREVLGDA